MTKAMIFVQALFAVVLLAACHRQNQLTTLEGGPTQQAETENVHPQGPPNSDQEVCDIQQTIVAFLRESPEPWTDEVASQTESSSCSLASDGSVQFSQWSMVPCDSECESTQVMRFLWNEEGVPIYAVEIERFEGEFLCTSLGQFMVAAETSQRQPDSQEGETP